MIWSSLSLLISIHSQCRGKRYPHSNIERFPVPDEKVLWSKEFKEYKPVNYTAPHIHGRPWADPEIGSPCFKPSFNSMDGKINRVSHMGTYAVENGYPVNPIGRTGINGRGLLGRWGPNHAADPIVSSWKRLETGEIALDKNNKPILKFVAVQRFKTKEWVLPGGMVEPGEMVTTTAMREFREEATNSEIMTNDEKQAWLEKFEKLFSSGDIVYQGYVDDRRNTDNAWIETVAFNFHDNSGSIIDTMKLNAGSDAAGACWMDITPDCKLNSIHKALVMEAYNKLLLKYSQ